MAIEEKSITHWIDHFYGYGSWEARFWFISHEESGGEHREEVAGKLDYFKAKHPGADSGTLCDIRDLYRHVPLPLEDGKDRVFATRYDYRFGANAVQNTVWKNLTAFRHGYQNAPLPDILQYQKSMFASAVHEQEALIRLYPLPAPHSHAWHYSWLDLPHLGFLRSREAYEAHVYPFRMRTILFNIKTHKPGLVMMYGMRNINRLKASVREVFPGATFKLNKATRKHVPQYHRADLGVTRLLITTQIPTLRHHRVETGFDWDAFGRQVTGVDPG